ncbi:DUF1049 domain-containing protein [Pseudomonas sp. YuFO8]|jgi:uncharacterized integral membrane protein|uniref:DUF1049 domain-containing protein n=1 Tax=Pseudomonas sp. YuFO8 TaxID=3095361 RepID=UPI002B2428D7|nr:DUF1049 domain-containing protein [Pseudomonas sp. YuFO8]MEB2625108.1 DUF1049 domain-containing protein [Pseudomonas sp. YuFO8]
MRNLTKIIMVALITVISAGILVFTIENQNSVSLVFLGGVAPPIAVSILILTAFLMGMAIAPILVFLRRNRLKTSKMARKG